MAMKCPSCGGELLELDRSGIKIDACRNCRGVWLDRGELDNILERERQVVGGADDEEFIREMTGGGGKERKSGYGFDTHTAREDLHRLPPPQAAQEAQEELPRRAVRLINAVHSILFARDADAARAFFADVLELDSVDAGGGWLIFALPPAELAIHPADDGEAAARALPDDRRPRRDARAAARARGHYRV